MAWKLATDIGGLPWRNFAKEAWERAAITVKFLCAMHVTSNYICGPQLTMGPSMLPTLNMSGDVLLVERLSTRFGNIKHGDLVIACSTENPKKTICKRVMGLEGDRVDFSMANQGQSQSVVVPKGHVWLQGDNLSISRDSRHFGPVPYGLLQGKIIFRWRLRWVVWLTAHFQTLVTTPFGRFLASLITMIFNTYNYQNYHGPKVGVMM